MVTLDNPAVERSSQNRYRTISKIGSGGMADVYLGMQLGEEDFERLVVIKKIHERWLEHESAVSMFVTEARTGALLRHPNIAGIYDLSRMSDGIAITMEYVDGETISYLLSTLRKAGKKMPADVALSLTIQAADALYYAHTATAPDGRHLNLIHRDVDTRNLMLDSNGYVKVIDFGVVRSTVQVELTTPGFIKGKLSYMAPESFQDKELDNRVDVYALGLVLYYMLTDTVPYKFSSDVSLGEVVATITGDYFPPPASVLRNDLSPDLDQVITGAIAKDREQRYATAKDFADALRAYATQHAKVMSPAELKAWFQSEFAERIEKRRAFEREAISRGRVATDVPPTSSIVPPPPASESLVPPSGSASKDSVSSYKRRTTPPPLPVEPSEATWSSAVEWGGKTGGRKKLVWISAILGVLLLTGMSSGYYYFQERNTTFGEKQLVAENEAAPLKIALGSASAALEVKDKKPVVEIKEVEPVNVPDVAQIDALAEPSVGFKRKRSSRRRQRKKNSRPVASSVIVEDESLSDASAEPALDQESATSFEEAKASEDLEAKTQEPTEETGAPGDTPEATAVPAQSASAAPKPTQKAATKEPSPSSKTKKSSTSVMRQKLATLLKRLPSDQRKVVVLNKLKGYDVAKIASMTNTDEATVRKLLDKGLKRMRSEIENNPEFSELKKWIGK